MEKYKVHIVKTYVKSVDTIFEIESESENDAKNLASEIFDELDIGDYPELASEHILKDIFLTYNPEVLKDSISIDVFEGEDDNDFVNISLAPEKE